MTARHIPTFLTLLTLVLAVSASISAQDKLNTPPPGFKALFNGKDLTGWKGLPLKPNMNAKKKESQPYVAMTMPERLSSPRDGLIPARPVRAEGHVTDPSVSVPSAAAHRFAEGAVPEPELDPHGLWSST